MPTKDIREEELLDKDIDSAEELWEELLPERKAPDQRARRTALVTLPYLATNYGQTRIGWNHREAPSLRAPYAGENGDVVLALGSKCASALWPTGSQSFFLGIDPITQIEQQGQEVKLTKEQRVELRRQGMQATSIVLSRLMALEIFPHTEQAEVQGMVMGGFLQSYKSRFRSYRMDTYVLDRDPCGAMLDIVVREVVNRRSLPLKYREMADRKVVIGPGWSGKKKEIQIFTWVHRTSPPEYIGQQEGDFKEWVEIESTRVTDDENQVVEGVYPANRPLPWTYVPWIQAYDEVYGRSKVEMLYGLHTAFEAITRMILEKGAAVSRHITFIARDSGIDIDEFLAKPNLGAMHGDFTKIGVPAASVNSDTNFLVQLWIKLQERLATAYGKPQYHPVERRSAAEATIQLQETQLTTAGVWALQVPRYQIPTVRMVVNDLIDEGVEMFPMLRSANLANALVPRVFGGLEVLNRNDEAMRRDLFYASATAYLGSAFAAYSDKYTSLINLAAAKGLDISEELLDGDAIKEMDRTAMLNEITKGVPLEIVKQAMEAAREQAAARQVPATNPQMNGTAA